MSPSDRTQRTLPRSWQRVIVGAAFIALAGSAVALYPTGLLWEAPATAAVLVVAFGWSALGLRPIPWFPRAMSLIAASLGIFFGVPDPAPPQMPPPPRMPPPLREPLQLAGGSNLLTNHSFESAGDPLLGSAAGWTLNPASGPLPVGCLPADLEGPAAKAWRGNCYAVLAHGLVPRSSGLAQDIQASTSPGARLFVRTKFRCSDYDDDSCRVTISLTGVGDDETRSINVTVPGDTDDLEWYECRLDAKHGASDHFSFPHRSLRLSITLHGPGVLHIDDLAVGYYESQPPNDPQPHSCLPVWLLGRGKDAVMIYRNQRDWLREHDPDSAPS